MKNWKKLAVSIISVLGAIFYRMGGSGNYPRWVRLVGQALCFAAMMVVLGLVAWQKQPILGVFIGMGLTFLESTYWKKKGTDAGTLSWILVGTVFAIIPLPYCGLTDSHWRGFAIRFPVCIGLTVLWQQKLSAPFAKAIGIGKDVSDECGRGLINIASLPLLLI